MSTTAEEATRTEDALNRVADVMAEFLNPSCVEDDIRMLLRAAELDQECEDDEDNEVDDATKAIQLAIAADTELQEAAEDVISVWEAWNLTTSLERLAEAIDRYRTRATWVAPESPEPVEPVVVPFIEDFDAAVMHYLKMIGEGAMLPSRDEYHVSHPDGWVLVNTNGFLALVTVSGDVDAGSNAKAKYTAELGL